MRRTSSAMAFLLDEFIGLGRVAFDRDNRDHIRPSCQLVIGDERRQPLKAVLMMAAILTPEGLPHRPRPLPETPMMPGMLQKPRLSCRGTTSSNPSPSRGEMLW